MHKLLVYRAGVALLLMLAIFAVFLSPPGDTIQAFNQANLIRVAEIREVDGQVFFKRVAPVTEFLP